MTKMNKANKLMAMIIAMIMIALTIGFAAQTSFVDAEDKGLAAYEQVMDDNEAAPAAEGEGLAAHEQVME